MGKGILGPSSNTVEGCEIPIFVTHPTPVNVSVKPIIVNQKKSYMGSTSTGAHSTGGTSPPQGDCCCTIS